MVITRKPLFSGVPAKVDTQQILSALQAHFMYELSLLAGDVNATPAASLSPNSDKSVGENLFPTKTRDEVKEVNRTIMGIFLLVAGWTNDYDFFVDHPMVKPEQRVSREDFTQLVTWTREHLPTQGHLEDMVRYLIIADLGKVKSLVAQSTSMDHDIALFELLSQRPEMFPTFQTMSDDSQKLTLESGLSKQKCWSR